MPSVADAVIVAAWAVVAVHNAVLVARGRARGRDLGRWTLGVVLLAGVVAAAIVLERQSGGPAAVPLVVRLLGTATAVAGALLHVGARRVLDAQWSSRADGASQLVERGPYALVRHPLYVGIGLLALGSIAAHPSAPVIAGGLGLFAGLAMKIAREERALAAAFGPRWDAYCRRVPRLVPRLVRRGR